jgi:hypothetical protein
VTAPEVVSACNGWTAHEIAAHVTGNAIEIVRHLKPYVQGDPVPRTRSFEERVAPNPPGAARSPGCTRIRDTLLEGIADTTSGPEARYQARYQATEAIELAFVAGLQRMPPRQAASLVLRDVLGYPAEEVAAMLQTSPAAVKAPCSGPVAPWRGTAMNPESRARDPRRTPNARWPGGSPTPTSPRTSMA